MLSEIRRFALTGCRSKVNSNWQYRFLNSPRQLAVSFWEHFDEPPLAGSRRAVSVAGRVVLKTIAGDLPRRSSGTGTGSSNSFWSAKQSAIFAFSAEKSKILSYLVAAGNMIPMTPHERGAPRY
jgi:hypothetical protein